MTPLWCRRNVLRPGAIVLYSSTYHSEQTSLIWVVHCGIWDSYSVCFVRLIYWSTHYCNAIMDTIASLITSFTIVYSTVYSGVDQRKHQSSASLAFVRGIHRGPVNSPHKWPVTRNMFPFDDVIMNSCWYKMIPDRILPEFIHDEGINVMDNHRT